MNSQKTCACKGIRTCLLCEDSRQDVKRDPAVDLKKLPSYVYCPECAKAWPGWDMDLYKEHPNHSGEAISFPGTYIKLNFLNEVEVKTLIKDLDALTWKDSQSGRRKQNFGPKTNFKKRRLRLDIFRGFPITTEFVQRRFKEVPLLKDFQTIEQCSLEYDPSRGSAIDPHIDDCWIWGERIVTVNVLGDSVLTMKPYRGGTNLYNLDCIGLQRSNSIPDEDIVVRIPMPQGSLIVLYGSSRYKWEHCILREDIKSRRVCLAYREFASPYLPDDQGRDNDRSIKILQNAKHFWQL